MTITELVRMVIRRCRWKMEAEAPSFERQLRETAGLWQGEDGLEYQNRLRTEWDER